MEGKRRQGGLFSCYTDAQVQVTFSLANVALKSIFTTLVRVCDIIPSSSHSALENGVVFVCIRVRDCDMHFHGVFPPSG